MARRAEQSGDLPAPGRLGRRLRVQQQVRRACHQLDPNLRLDEASFGEQVDWHVEQGFVPTPIAIEQALDPSFAEFAVQRLV